ncbi:POLX protein, partial [Pseudoatta argentina]
MASQHTVRIEPLGKDNFDTWRIQMEALLVKSDSWSVVSGESVKPEATAEDASAAAAAARTAWERTDRTAKSDIILAISPSELKLIKGCETSHALWQRLQATYQSAGPARKASLLKKLTLHRMTDGEEIRDHLRGFFDTVDKLGEMEVEINPDLLTIMLLYSLPPAFENFRCAIESRDALPTPEALRIKIIEEADAPPRKVEDLSMYASSDFSPPQNAFEIESAPEREKWCLDSGCSSHLCRDTRDFSEISNVANGTLNLATKASTEIKARGTVLFTGDVNGITKRVSVKDTLHVPELRTNLLSVGKITDRGYKVIFDKFAAEIVDKRNRQTVLFADRKDGLYYIRESKSECCAATEKKESRALKTWHQRMGHLNVRDLVKYVRAGDVRALEAFKEFKAYAERQTGKRIKYLQSDNGREYCNSEFDAFLREHGIGRRLTTTYTPEQNGVSERRNRTLVEMARCLLIQSQLPPSFWAEAVNTSNYIRNRCPSSSLNGRTPFEAWTGKLPDVSHFRSFGQKVYVLNRDPKKGKFDDRSKKGIFLGYSDVSKGYRVWISGERRVDVSRDVKFLDFSEDAIADKFEDFYDDKRQTNNENELGIEIELCPDEAKIDIREGDALSEQEEEIDNPGENRPGRGPGRARIVRTGLRGRPKKAHHSARLADEECANLAEIPTNMAMSGPEKDLWISAMKSELEAVLMNGTWVIVERPEN